MLVSDSLALVASMQFGISGPLDCHVYALRAPEGVLLIDAGGGTHTPKLLANLSRDFPGLPPKAVLLTHSHLDHCGGAASLRQMTGCKILAPEVSRSILEGADEEGSGLRLARELGIYPPDFRMQSCPVDRSVHDAESFQVAGQQFTAIHVRGHSLDSFCYLTSMAGSRWLFAGDTVFYGGLLGLINAEGSGMDGYRRDLRKLNDLQVEGLFPGHGLFTLCGGQRHVDHAIEQLSCGFLGRQIGQGDQLF
jgi:hydroxyacylglutathione hydrolase